MRIPRTLLVAAALGGLLADASVWAAAVNVSPTRVVITSGATSGALALRNLGTTLLRFQIKAFVWTNGPAGEMQLVETDEVIAFPALFNLDAGATRTIRVGVKGTTGSTERTYRLLIEELPSRAEAPTEQGIVMRTRLNVPVFAEPRGKRFKATLEQVSLVGDTAVVTVANVGTVRATPIRYELIGADAAGSPVWRHDLTPWYLLAGERREQKVPLDAERCRSARTITAEIEFQEQPGAPLRESVALDRASCPR